MSADIHDTGEQPVLSEPHRTLSSMEDILRAERNFVSAVLSTVAALVIVLDRDGNVVRFNPACERLTGYSFQELRGRPFWEVLIPRSEMQRTMQAFHSLRSGSFPARFQSAWQHRSGTLRNIDWTNTCLLDDDGAVEYVIGTGLDVTEQLRTQEEVRKRLVELAHLHRLHTAGEMASALAHELNQPLTAISSYCAATLNLQKRDALDSEQLAYSMEQISLQVARAGEIIRELRSFVSKAARPAEPRDLNTVVRRTALLTNPDARLNHVQFDMQLDDNVPPVLASDLQLEHVLINLVRNGIEAMQEAQTSDRVITIVTRRDCNTHARVEVIDRGPGLTAEQITRIFQPFYTTKEQGLGMGLQIARSIIESLSGRLWVEPSPSAGARFCFTVPLAQE